MLTAPRHSGRNLRGGRAFAALFAALAAFTATAAVADYPQAQTLLEADRTVAGEAFRYPAEAPPRVTAVIVTVAPGSSTGWHRHGVPMFAYLLSGELEVEYATGRRAVLRAGDALMEAMTVAHVGTNLGGEPARVLAVFMGTADSVKTVAAAAPDTPPPSPAATATPDLVDLAEADPALRLDIRYATPNNFMGAAVYPAARALLQRPAAEALRRAHQRLRAQGYGIAVLDAYRPWRVTRMMWDRFPAQRAYLADPLQGSRHNRGAAVDVTLFDVATGAEVDMPSAYDDFSERAHPDYAGGTAAQRAARDRLRAAMEAEGFSVYPNEWWHFDYRDWQSYPVLDQPIVP
jgi:D-alanyl-D-alanine dipeptidase